MEKEAGGFMIEGRISKFANLQYLCSFMLGIKTFVY